MRVILGGDVASAMIPVLGYPEDFCGVDSRPGQAPGGLVFLQVIRHITNTQVNSQVSLMREITMTQNETRIARFVSWMRMNWVWYDNHLPLVPQLVRIEPSPYSDDRSRGFTRWEKS